MLFLDSFHIPNSISAMRHEALISCVYSLTSSHQGAADREISLEFPPHSVCSSQTSFGLEEESFALSSYWLGRVLDFLFLYLFILYWLLFFIYFLWLSYFYFRGIMCLVVIKFFDISILYLFTLFWYSYFTFIFYYFYLFIIHFFTFTTFPFIFSQSPYSLPQSLIPLFLS